MADLLDVQLLHALQIDGRAPFTLIADVLGVSDQTVARRYQRLRAAGLLRVRGLLEPARSGGTQWLVRIRCTPNGALALAQVLARRADTSWISLTAGGTEIICVADAPSSFDQPVPLLQRLPLGQSIVSVDAQCLLHEFFGGTRSLVDKNGPLTPDQVQALREASGDLPSGDGPDRSRPDGIRTVDPGDEALLRALKHDGRATVTSLASSTGWSQSAVRRRIMDLVEAGLLYFDVDFSQDLFDLRMRAVMWLRVPADRIGPVGRSLAAHPEVGYVAATTGSTNLYAAVSCRTADSFYGYLTDRVAGLSAVQHLETVPIVQTVKTSSVLTPAEPLG